MLEAGKFGKWLSEFHPHELVSDPLDFGIDPLTRYLIESGGYDPTPGSGRPFPTSIPIWAYQLAVALRNLGEGPYSVQEVKTAFEAAVAHERQVIRESAIAASGH